MSCCGVKYDIPVDVQWDVQYNGMGYPTIAPGISHRISMREASITWSTGFTRYSMGKLGHPIGYPMYMIWDIP